LGAQAVFVLPEIRRAQTLDALVAVSIRALGRATLVVANSAFEQASRPKRTGHVTAWAAGLSTVRP